MPRRPHAHTGIRASRFGVNRLSLPEGGINAVIACHFDVSVVMASRDRAAVEGLRNLLGEVELAQVKGQQRGYLSNRAASSGDAEAD